MRTHPKRRNEILTLLSNRGELAISELARHFGVSEMTIRRDLSHLTEAGRIIRTPGGATIRRAITFERDYAERLQRMSEAKEKIGKAAAALVKEGESVVLDSGTTTLCVARHLRGRSDVVVVTFSLAVLDDLHAARVELTGGAYRRSSLDLVGPRVAESLANLHANKVFFGAAAVSFKKGVMVNDPEGQPMLLHAGTERILVVDSSKIGTEALYHFCKLEECDLIITDSDIKPEDLRRLRKIREVLVAS